MIKPLILKHYSPIRTVSASLNRHLSTLFSKICQLLNVLFSKISPQNLDFFIDRRRFIDADTVVLENSKIPCVLLFLNFFSLQVHNIPIKFYGNVRIQKSFFCAATLTLT